MTNDQCPNCGAAKRRDLNEYGRIEYECGSCCHGIIPNTGEQAGPYITDDCQLRAARAEVARLRAVVEEHNLRWQHAWKLICEFAELGLHAHDYRFTTAAAMRCEKAKEFCLHYRQVAEAARGEGAK